LIKGVHCALVGPMGFADRRMTQIGRVIRWIGGPHAEALRIDDLAHIAGMSMGSFHRHYRAVTSMTPIQYQKQIRLQTARTLLMSAAEDVVAVGFAVGYQSPSQFTREYRQQFGEPPGKDRKRLRATKEVE